MQRALTFALKVETSESFWLGETADPTDGNPAGDGKKRGKKHELKAKGGVQMELLKRKDLFAK